MMRQWQDGWLARWRFDGVSTNILLVVVPVRYVRYIGLVRLVSSISVGSGSNPHVPQVIYLKRLKLKVSTPTRHQK